MTRKLAYLIGFILVLFFVTACGVPLKHIPSQKLDSISVKRPVKIMVADIGDARMDEAFDKIGQGVSYWLPVSFYARDESGQQLLAVSYYLANSLTEDLNKIGYQAALANDPGSMDSLSIEKAKIAAKKNRADYLLTTKVNEGKTNFWGFLVIPFVEPVWTRIELECQLINIRSPKNAASIKTYKKKVEWYFAKVTILDAIFDAGLFGKNWHQSAWGKTVVSDALADTAQQISENIK